MKRSTFFFRFSFCLLLLSLTAITSRAQVAQYPVQVITQVMQATPYVPQYYTGTFPRLRVTISNLDFQNSTLQVLVRMRITSSFFSLYTPEYIWAFQTILDSGQPLQLSGEDLAVFFPKRKYSIQW
jgi:hypothetical protein